MATTFLTLVNDKLPRLNEVEIKTETSINRYEFPKYKRGIDYFVLTPKLRNVYRGDLKYSESGIQQERPRDYWLALPNYVDLSKKISALL